MSEKQSNRGVLLALVLTASAASGAGCATHRTHPYAEFDPPTKGVLVIANDVVIPDPLPVSEKKKETVKWASFPGTTLSITFDAPSPFPDLHCNNNHCESGPIKEKSAYKAYAYHAGVSVGPSSSPASSAAQKPSGDPTVVIEY
jgi:hypothetical protein